MKIRVYYEDTDAGGIVYHTNYIKYCERARSEIFFKQDQIPSLSQNSGFVVRDIKASFLATSALGDMLEVTTNIMNIKNSSILLLQEIWKKNIKIFSMEILLVYVDKGKSCPIPKIFRDIFQSF